MGKIHLGKVCPSTIVKKTHRKLETLAASKCIQLILFNLEFSKSFTYVYPWDLLFV